MKANLKEEERRILASEKLLSPEQLCDRWGVTANDLARFRRRTDEIRLPALRFTRKIIRYRLCDIEAIEQAARLR